MALVTAYLARTAQAGSGRIAASATVGFFGRVLGIFRAVRLAFVEAQDLHRTMSRKYPFMDV